MEGKVGLTKAEVAERLSVAEGWVAKLLKQGRLAYVKGSTLIDRASVAEYEKGRAWSPHHGTPFHETPKVRAPRNGRKAPAVQVNEGQAEPLSVPPVNLPTRDDVIMRLIDLWQAEKARADAAEAKLAALEGRGSVNEATWQAIQAHPELAEALK